MQLRSEVIANRFTNDSYTRVLYSWVLAAVGLACTFMSMPAAASCCCKATAMSLLALPALVNAVNDRWDTPASARACLALATSKGYLSCTAVWAQLDAG